MTNDVLLKTSFTLPIAIYLYGDPVSVSVILQYCKLDKFGLVKNLHSVSAPVFVKQSQDLESNR